MKVPGPKRGTRSPRSLTGHNEGENGSPHIQEEDFENDESNNWIRENIFIRNRESKDSSMATTSKYLITVSGNKQDLSTMFTQVSNIPDRPQGKFLFEREIIKEEREEDDSKNYNDKSKSKLKSKSSSSKPPSERQQFIKIEESRLITKFPEGWNRYLPFKNFKKEKKVLARTSMRLGLDSNKYIKDTASMSSGFLCEGSWNIKSGKYIKKNMLPLARLPVISPFSYFNRIWDLIFLASILALAAYAPLWTCFDLNFDGLKFLLFSLVLIFLGDMLMSLNVGFFIDGRLCEDRTAIARSYFKGPFLIDACLILSCVVTFLFIERHRYISLLFFLILLKAPRLCAIYQGIRASIRNVSGSYSNYSDGLMSIINICFEFFYSVHFSTCLANLLILSPSSDVPYIQTFYKTLVTFLNLNSLDYEMNNVDQILVAGFISFFGLLVYLYTLKRTWDLVSIVNSEREKLRAKQLTLSKALFKKSGVSKLREEIYNYFNFLWSKESDRSRPNMEQLFVSQMSSRLRERYITDFYKNIIYKFPILSNNFSEEFLSRVALMMKKVEFRPEESIYKDHQSEEKLYLLLDGEVELYLKHESGTALATQVEVIKANQAIGEICFFTGIAPRLGAVSRGFTSAIEINRQQFLEELKSFQSDFEKFAMIKDSIILYEKFDALKLRCPSCHECHPVERCHRLFYQPNKIQLVARLLYSKPQQRQQKILRDSNQQIRKRKKAQHTLLQMNYVRKSARSYYEKEREFLYYLLRKRKSLILSLYQGSEIDNEASYESGDEEDHKTAESPLKEESPDDSLIDMPQKPKFHADNLSDISFEQKTSNVISGTVKTETKKSSKTSKMNTNTNSYVNMPSNNSDDFKDGSNINIDVLPRAPHNENIAEHSEEGSKKMMTSGNYVTNKANFSKIGMKTDRSIGEGNLAEGNWEINNQSLATLDHTFNIIDNMKTPFVDYDIIKSWEIYFPHNNVDQVLNGVKKSYMKRKLKMGNKVY